MIDETNITHSSTASTFDRALCGTTVSAALSIGTACISDRCSSSLGLAGSFMSTRAGIRAAGDGGCWSHARAATQRGLAPRAAHAARV